MPPLSNATLQSLHPGVAVPRYDRQAVRPSIVHIGVGGFHRSHQAVYVDEVLSRGHVEWGVCGVGLLPSDRRMATVMREQDCLYTLVLKDTDRASDPRVVGAIARYLFAPDDTESVLSALANPATRVVSMTITEGGYLVSDATGEFDADHPDVVEDLASDAAPRTVFGLVTEALARRKAHDVAGFTIVSCDNMPGNGHVARSAFTSFARLRNRELADWIDERVSFPNSMVDRITPVITDDDRQELLARYDVSDGWPVVAEPFTQWVLEDNFVDRRPPLEEVGVQLVGDVEPYELMKLRLLNASHQVMGYLGYLAGHRYVHEVARDRDFAALLTRYMRDEAAPTLSAVAGIDLGNYQRTLLTRFSNAAIKDSLARNCTDGSDRIPKFVLPVVRHQLAQDGDISVAATAIAGWARYLEGVDESGRLIDVSDRRLGQLAPLVAAQRSNPEALLGVEEVFGDVADHPRFRSAFREALESLTSRGARATIEALTAKKR